ncbi:acyl-CoA dehydrogenase family protein [Amycolatopsis sp. NPDC004079]|uniref:acyl-CoA dehydrogenase family protein n=1 Tax=Amycolatopsis sp. NPDC004079 TaxID=3154549 RepID=UPI0033A891C1
MNDTLVRDGVLRTATRLADELLRPAAPATDAAGELPAGNLDSLAEAGMYGLVAPPEAGGLGADFPVLCSVIETLAGACLTTAFVWTQHLGVLQAVMHSDSARQWVPRLSSGEVRAGLAMAGTLPGPPKLRAVRRDGGWTIDGTAPWVSGWGGVDVVHTAARDAEDNVVWLLVDARENPALRAEPLELVALNSTCTVRLEFDGCFVPADRVTAVVPPEHWQSPNPFAMRLHAALSLGLAARASALAGDGALESELAACRAALDAALAAHDEMPAARAAAAELALRATALATVAAGTSAVLPTSQVQRLSREASFLLVFGLRAPVRTALIERLERPPA